MMGMEQTVGSGASSKVALSLGGQAADHRLYRILQRAEASAIGYIAPKDKLEGRGTLIFKERDRKLSVLQILVRMMNPVRHEELKTQ